MTDPREWQAVNRDDDPELYGYLAALAMDLGGPGDQGMATCVQLMHGEAVPLDALNQDAVLAYGLRVPATNGRVTLGDFNLVRDRSDPDAAPFAMEADEFRAEVDEAHVPLLGRNGDTVLPAEGLAVVAGQPGVGKTTVVLDLVYHLASGRDWLDIPVPRPLNVLLVENEGPQHMFRAKVDTKANAWQHDRPGRVWVQTWRWGLFSLADSEARAMLGSWCLEHGVDVVVGDPLGTMGAEGAGSPEDTRRFVLTLLQMGLPTAWLFVHHFRKDPTPDEVNQLSGAWAGHLDALLLVKPHRRRNEVRLSFPKLRWAEQQHDALVLGYVANTQALEVLGAEGTPELQLHELVAALADGVPRTPTEVAKAAGMRRSVAVELMEGNRHLFESTEGANVSRPHAKVVWRVVPSGGTSWDKLGEGDNLSGTGDKLDKLDEEALF